MLVMASAASVGATDDPYTVAEARQKIGRMVKTSLDPSTVIKGTELLAKLDQVDRDRGATDNDYDRGDGFLVAGAAQKQEPCRVVFRRRGGIVAAQRQPVVNLPARK